MKYPVYKDLEPYKEYDFDIINDLHHDIITNYWRITRISF